MSDELGWVCLETDDTYSCLACCPGAPLSYRKKQLAACRRHASRVKCLKSTGKAEDMLLRVGRAMPTGPRVDDDCALFPLFFSLILLSFRHVLFLACFLRFLFVRFSPDFVILPV